MKSEEVRVYEVLNEVDSKNCNGGSVAPANEIKLLPPVVYPIPDPEEKGRL